MNEHGRRPEDGIIWKIARDFWPILLALVSIVSMYTSLEGRVVAMDGRISSIEKAGNDRAAVISGHETRITRVETLILGWDKRMDVMEDKLDKIYSALRK